MISEILTTSGEHAGHNTYTKAIDWAKFDTVRVDHAGGAHIVGVVME